MLTFFVRNQCDPKNPCDRCVSALQFPKVFRLPCFRARLNGIIAFRAGNSRAGKIRSEPMNTPRTRSASNEIANKTVRLYYPFEDQCAGVGDAITVTCRRFVPHPSDVRTEPWKKLANGQILSLESPAYACVSHRISSNGCFPQLNHCSLIAQPVKGKSRDILTRIRTCFLRRV